MKRIFSSKCKNWGSYGLLLMILLFSGNAFAGLSDGLIVHYTFDEMASANSVADKSGNGNDGKLFGNAAVLPDQGVDGGGALYLATVSQPASDYLQIQDDITVGMHNFTVATWVKINDSQAWQRIFDFGNGTVNNMFLAVRTGGTGVRFAIKIGNEQFLDGPTLQIGEWAHVAVSTDYSTSTSRIYLNGVEVASRSGVTHLPDGMGSTNQNYIGKSQYNDKGFAGYIDDFRVYDRALSDSEILEINGFTPAEINAFLELNQAYQAFLEMEDEILGENDSFLDIRADLNLMTRLSDYENITLTWESSNEDVIATDGKRTAPEGAVSVELKVTFSNSAIPSLTREKKFALIVAAGDPLPMEVAFFTFENAIYQDGKVKVVSSADNPAKYVGSFENGAKVRIIGSAGNEHKVLDLGAGNGYFDMGKEIGEAFCQLTDYTMSCYYFVEEDALGATSAGNFLWSFSNSENVSETRDGYIFAQPWNSQYSITKTYYTGEQKVANTEHFSSEAEYKGKWHNLLYSQKGNTGTLYVDGESVASSSTISLLPVYLKLAGRSGTDFNYLGRSPYTGDSYMSRTLLHDFRMYAYGLADTDVSDLGIEAKLAELDAAYIENNGRDRVNPELVAVYNALTIDVPSRITENQIFPKSIDGHPGVVIGWTTSNESVLDGEGNVIRQKYYDYPVKTITANLMDASTGEMMSKTFYVESVVPKLEGTALPANDLLVHYDFSQVDDRIVTDQAELQLKGTLMNEAEVVSFEAENGDKINVLKLGDGTGYFDMGAEIGQIMYHTTDYTLGAYVYIDEKYNGASEAGNYLWTFANSEGRNGNYIAAILSEMRLEMFKSPDLEGVTAYMDEKGNNMNKAPEQGQWFHFAYSQDGTIGSVYINGENVNSVVIKNIPSATLPMEGRVGTVSNWIGRSNYMNHAYLRQSYITDFRFYGVPLDDSDLESRLGIAAMLNKLNNSAPSSIKNVEGNSSYRVYVKESELIIDGLIGSENIAVFDIMGRQYDAKANASIVLASGMYIVKINDFTTKVMVK